MRNALKSVVNEMNLSLSRSAHSAIITEGNDHCGAIFDTDGNLVMQGDTDLPIFVGIIEFPCRTIVQGIRQVMDPKFWIVGRRDPKNSTRMPYCAPSFLLRGRNAATPKNFNNSTGRYFFAIPAANDCGNTLSRKTFCIYGKSSIYKYP